MVSTISLCLPGRAGYLPCVSQLVSTDRPANTGVYRLCYESDARGSALFAETILPYLSTLRGLMLQHVLDPEVFLDYVYAIDHSILRSD